MDLVSVIMPVYNNERFVREAIQGILYSKYENIEVIIVDDGSIDSSIEIIYDYIKMDNRIRILRNEHNLGTALAVKNGIRESRGKYIIFAAADDISFEHRIEKSVSIFRQDKKVGVIASNAAIINEDGIETGEIYNINNNITNDNISLEQFKRNYCLGATMAIVNDKSILLKEDNLTIMDDYEIALDFLMHDYNIYITRENYVYYRIHNKNQSNNNKLLMRKTKEVLKKYSDEDILKNLKGRGFSQKDILITLGIINLLKDFNHRGHRYLSMAEENDNINTGVKSYYENKFYLGVSNYKIGNIDVALIKFIEAFSIYKQEPTLLNNIAVLSKMTNINDEYCIGMLTKAIEIYPDYFDAKYNLQSLLTDNGEKLKLTERILDIQKYSRKEYLI